METPKHSPALVSSLIFFILAFGVTGYFAFFFWEDAQTTKKELVTQTEVMEERIIELEGRLLLAQNENVRLEEDLEDEKERNDEFEDKIGDIAGTVGTLEKLSKTDPELLQKYSKVYFLNEHYTPPRLSSIDKEFRSDPSRSLQIHTEVEPYLEDLLEAAQDDDLTLAVASAFRSFGTQSVLKAGYSVTYGVGANQFSADQGYSEHQLGTTVDFTTDSLAGALNGFEHTPEYAWLLKNAYRYGFILSYPSGNAYYQFEPWHWRFVGTDLARYLDRQNKKFYEVDQRTIDEYLVNIFD
jgi:D-alanyl-D-alanine carboxypeptidase